MKPIIIPLSAAMKLALLNLETAREKVRSGSPTRTVDDGSGSWRDVSPGTSIPAPGREGIGDADALASGRKLFVETGEPNHD